MRGAEPVLQYVYRTPGLHAPSLSRWRTHWRTDPFSPSLLTHFTCFTQVWVLLMAAAALRSSPEKTNGAKLSRLIIDGGTVALRRVFDSIHLPATLQAVLSSNYTTIERLFRKTFITKPQWDLLFPPDGSSPDSSQFDVTLLFALLRNINICGLNPPPSGWKAKPSPTDETKEADLVRIKWYRNKMSHVTTTGVDASSFTTYWRELADALVRLGLSRDEIDRLEHAPLDEDRYLGLSSECKVEDDDTKEQLRILNQNTEEIKKQVTEISGKMDVYHRSTEVCTQNCTTVCLLGDNGRR